MKQVKYTAIFVTAILVWRRLFKLCGQGAGHASFGSGRLLQVKVCGLPWTEGGEKV